MIKAFFFDIDNTLLDSLDGHDESFYLTCEEYGVKISDEFKNQKLTRVSSHKLEILAKEGLIDRMDIPWMLERKNEIAMDTCFKNFTPSQDHLDVMQYVDKNLNCKIALCSNSPRKFVNKFVKNCSFENIISFTLSGEDVELKKPYGDIYKKALRLLSIEPHETIVIEDSEEGRLAAVRAGIHQIAEISNPKDVNMNLIKEIVKTYKI